MGFQAKINKISISIEMQYIAIAASKDVSIKLYTLFLKPQPNTDINQFLHILTLFFTVYHFVFKK